MTASLPAIDLGTTRIKFGALDGDGSYRLGALQETLATLSAGAPDASRVERDRHVKLLDGNTWPMS
jgi:hypothetical protein